jgi:predicted amidohydrolase YtcJ
MGETGQRGRDVVADSRMVEPGHPGWWPPRGTSRRSWCSTRTAAWAPHRGSLHDEPSAAAAGTDATRASSYSPWLSLRWLITGRSLDGVARRAPEHLFSRAQALAAYTSGSAWLSFEEQDRGHLRPGARADFAVLDRDYFSVEEEEIPRVSSELTVVGGEVVHSSGTVAEAAPGQDGPRLRGSATPTSSAP